MDSHRAWSRSWGSCHRANGRSEHTLEQYARHVRLLCSWCAAAGRSAELQSFDHDAVAAFLSSRQALQRVDGRPKRTATVNALRAGLRGLFRYLHQAGHTQVDLGLLIRSALGGRSAPKGIPVEDQQRLVGALTAATGTFEDRRDRALFLTMLRTGTRRNAALQAEVEDLDLVAGELALRRCKAGQEHLVFLPQDAIDGKRPAAPPAPRWIRVSTTAQALAPRSSAFGSSAAIAQGVRRSTSEAGQVPRRSSTASR